jgi:hypothetical protein
VVRLCGHYEPSVTRMFKAGIYIRHSVDLLVTAMIGRCTSRFACCLRYADTVHDGDVDV